MQEELDLTQVYQEALRAMTEVCERSGIEKGDIVVVGCSTSEISGGHIGQASSLETARAVFRGIYPLLWERKIFLAAQCCEHLNRALIIEAACAQQYGYDPVSVHPQPAATKAFAPYPRTE